MSKSVVFIDPEIQAAIDALVAEARMNCIPWEVLQPHALTDHEGSVVTLADRKGTPPRPEPRHLMLGNVEVAFSFEEQPAGLVRHLSVSVATKGMLPGIEAVLMIAEHFGFGPPAGCQVWVEEFAPGWYAANVVEIAEPRGHA